MRQKSYNIVIKHSAIKELRSIPNVMQESIRSRVEALAQDPFPIGFEKIQGYEHHFRIRIRNYRIIYAVTKENQTITIIRIGHRKEVYRQL